MSRPSPVEASRLIADLLSSSVAETSRLKDVLGREKEALATQDIDTLNSAIETKSKCVAKLHSLEQQRRDLCAACGFEPGPNQFQQMTSWCDSDASIQKRWEQLMTIAAECDASNMTNGSIIRLRQQQIEAGLTVLRGGEPGQDTYDRHGTGSRGRGHRSLAEA